MTRSRRQFDAHGFYSAIKYHLIEICSILSLVIVLYKIVVREW